MDVAGRLAENSFAFIAFLVVIIVVVVVPVIAFGRTIATFARTLGTRALDILDKRLGEIVTRVESLVHQQREDSDRLSSSIAAHDEHSQQRHDAMMRQLEQHHQVAQALAEQIRAERR